MSCSRMAWGGPRRWMIIRGRSGRTPSGSRRGFSASRNPTNERLGDRGSGVAAGRNRSRHGPARMARHGGGHARDCVGRPPRPHPGGAVPIRPRCGGRWSMATRESTRTPIEAWSQPTLWGHASRGSPAGAGGGAFPAPLDPPSGEAVGAQAGMDTLYHRRCQRGLTKPVSVETAPACPASTA